MPIVSISRGATSHGQEVAERVARSLSCRCLGREEVIRETGLRRVEELEVVRALDEPPSFLDRLLGGRKQYLAAARVALLSQLGDHDVVYHGFAGHFFLKDIARVLKVRVLADQPDRVARLAARDGLSPHEAAARLQRLEQAQRQWALRVCGVDPEDPALYDVVLHLGKMGTEEVSDIICDLARQEPFVSTEESRLELRDLTLAASVEAVLLEMGLDPESVDMRVNDGNVTVRVHQVPRTLAGSGNEFRGQYLESLQPRLRELSRSIPGLKAVFLEAAKE